MRKTRIFGVGFGIILSIVIGIYFVNQVDFQEQIPESDVDEVFWKNSLFRVFVNENDWAIVDGKTIPLKADFVLNEQLQHVYDEVGVYNLEVKPAVIIPTFTASAYGPNGFYDFYEKRCNESCLTTTILRDSYDFKSSANAIKILDLLGYEMILDEQVDKDPNILEKYDKIILLHNEYVTKTMFDAITSHPNVVYLYPNALYAEIDVNYQESTISLIRGHNYPEPHIVNGFDWEFENTHPFEFDTICANWEFYRIDNGVMLNCYPEQIVWQDKEFLEAIKNQ